MQKQIDELSIDTIPRTMRTLTERFDIKMKENSIMTLSRAEKKTRSHLDKFEKDLYQNQKETKRLKGEVERITVKLTALKDEVQHFEEEIEQELDDKKRHSSQKSIPRRVME